MKLEKYYEKSISKTTFHYRKNISLDNFIVNDENFFK